MAQVMGTRLAADGGPPVRADYLVFGQPLIEEDEIAEVVDSLRKRWIGTGPKVGRFEQMVADYVGVPFARALNSCTAGLHLTMLAAGIGPGDEVITTPMTFAATVNAIMHVGATPVLADIDPHTWNIRPDAIAAAVTPRTKAIMPVHMAGRPCDMDAIGAIAAEHGIVVIEDGAHAIGAEYHGQRVGSISDATVFSFYATKNIVTGEGGMVTTRRRDWAETIEVAALHGLSTGAWQRYSDEGFRHYGVVVPGFKYNMMDLQASLGLHQFPRLERWRDHRDRIWAAYDEAFADLPVELPAPDEPNTVHARHLYQVLIDEDRLGRDRDWVQNALHAENIGTGIHFVAVHLHPWYREHMAWNPGDFPEAERVSRRTISLPLGAAVTDCDVADVIEAVTKVLTSATVSS